MSDEDHEHEHPHPFHFIQVGPTEEQVELMRMQAQNNGHEFIQTLESFNDEQLKLVKGMLATVIDSDGSAGHYYQGSISSLLHFKRNICLVCGVDHDKSLSDMTGGQFVPPPDHQDQNRYECCRALVGKPHEAICIKLAEYNVEINDDGDTKVMCRNCGQWYPSLEDRMMNRPDKAGCSGCKQKEAWG